MKRVVWAGVFVVTVGLGGGPTQARAEPPAVEADPASYPSEEIATPPPVAADEPCGDALAPQDVQCAAARNSSLATLLDTRRAASYAPRRAFCARAAKQAHARRVVLALAAEEARNGDAGIALDLYWSLAEAEYSLRELGPAVAVTEQGLADHATLTDRGIELPFDEATLVTRRLALDDAAVAATAARDGLSVALARLTCLPPGTIATVHPDLGRAEPDAPPDVERLVADGIARRPQLRMLRAMLAHLDDDTAETGALVLSLVHPGLGIAAGGQDAHGALARRRRDGDAATVARQLRELLHERETAVAAEIRRAVGQAVAASERVVIAERQVELAARVAINTRSRQAVAEADAFKVQAADLELAAAKRTLVERLASWQRAGVDVREAQGLLAAECGLAASP